MSRIALALAAAIFIGSPMPHAEQALEHGTWSLVATDPARGEVGVALASCIESDPRVARRDDGYRVSVYVDSLTTYELAHLVPGRGAIVSQGTTDSGNGARLDRAARVLRSGGSAAAAIAAAREGDANDARRQHGAATLSGPPAAANGDNLPAWAGNAAGERVSVQGNVLASDKVVPDARAAFEASRGTLADALLAGLKAGDAAGGDSRCPGQSAVVAFLVVTSTTDEGAEPMIWSNASVTKGGKHAVAVLESNYQAMRSKGTELPIAAFAAAGVGLLVLGGGAAWYVRRRRLA